jgi:hypothetical protein
VTSLRAPTGYTVTKCLRASRASEVHTGVRDDDGITVILKAYLRDRSHESTHSLARRELEALRAAAGSGTPAPLDLIIDPGHAILVLEHVPGMDLQEWLTLSGPPALESFLEMAIQLTHVLGRVHAARLVHGGIDPTSVIVEPETLRTHLVAFGSARPLGISGTLESERPHADVMLKLSYAAPEHTGRMGRGVDFRSDLYSLGATLYFVLTGRAPFESDDALALIHAHMARAPSAPSELRSDTPAAISRIVLKLLQKDPEGRYQTAGALERDLLECQQQLVRSGQIDDDFPLGTADAPHRPLFSKHLYGRDAENVVLIRAYERAASGNASLLLVSGPPGVGKSGLVRALRTSLVRTGGYLALGKYDLYRSGVPYSGFAQALESLTHQILSESDARLADWRRQLNAALGVLAGVLAQLVPDFAIVLGEVAPVPALGPSETRERLSLALQRLLHALANREHPLVLCLDDLQWSDAGSRELLSALLKQDPGRALLVIGCYRDTDLDGEHPLVRWLNEIDRAALTVEELKLQPLSGESCAQMLADALGRAASETRALAACVSRKTGNTPLLIQQFVDHMYHVGLIRYEPSVGWTWDDAALAGVDIPHDALVLLTARISRLDAHVMTVLELASCVGDQFQSDTLEELSQIEAAAISAALFTLCEEGLIAPVRAGFRFVHDRIREAAQALLSPREAARIHHHGAQLLLARLSAVELHERAFEIADHLDLGAEYLTEEERPRAIGVHIAAGKRALQLGVAATATRYARAAHALFRSQDWAAHPQLAFDLWMLRADAAYQQSEFASALEILDELAARPLSRMSAAQVAAKVLTTRQLMPGGRSLSVSLAALRSFGVDWPERPSWLRTRWSILTTDLALAGGRNALALRPLGPGDHTRWLAPLLLIGPAGGSMTAETGRLMCLATSYVLRHFRRDGYLASPALALAAYAGYRLAFLRHLRDTEVYAQAAVTWNERLPHPVYGVRVGYLLHAFIYGWLRPRRPLAESLRVVAEAAREVGDLEYVYYALLQRANYLSLSGASLPAVEKALESIQHSAVSLEPHRAAVRLLRAGIADPEQLRAAIDALPSPLAEGRVALLSPWVFWLEIVCLLGGWERASALLAQVGSAVFEVGSTLSHVADFTFLRGLIATERSPRWSAWCMLGRDLRQLRIWARHGPDFVHLAQGLAAERARLRRSHARALDLYQSAAQRAEQQGYPQHAALLHERRSQLLEQLRRGTEAAAALRATIALYQSWGADTKVAQLEHRRSELSWKR